MRDIVRLKTERELVRIKIDDGNAFWKEIGVNTGVLKLMLLSLKLNAAKLKLMLLGLIYCCPLLRQTSRGNVQAQSSVQYELSVNPTIYTTCIEQFWTSAKVKIVNRERHIQALVDKKKVIISETSIRSDLKLDDDEGIDCLPTTTIFAELERMGAKTTSWNEFSSTMASAIICLATNQKFNISKYIFYNRVKNLDGGVNFLMYPRFVQVFLDKQVKGMSKHKGVYVTPSYTKKVFANMKRPCKCFYGRVTPLFSIMMVQATKDMGEDSAAPSDCHSTPIIS
ncbi:hypothetical protein Tco_1087065 [Tanacetum coccineum]